MSVRFFKILLGVLFVHLVVLSVVWVGFSAPLPRPPVTFTYEGALPAEDAASGSEDVWQKDKASDQLISNHLDNSNINHWSTLRDPSRGSPTETFGDAPNEGNNSLRGRL